MKNKRFVVNSLDGSLEHLGPFATHYHVEAPTKTLALAKLARVAAMFIDHSPKLKFKNGAWQMVTPHQDGGWWVQAGVEGRSDALCCTTVPRRIDVTDDTASFNYYASEEYRSAQ